MLDLILILNIGKAKPPLVLPPAPLMTSFSCWNQAAFILPNSWRSRELLHNDTNQEPEQQAAVTGSMYLDVFCFVSFPPKRN